MQEKTIQERVLEKHEIFLADREKAKNRLEGENIYLKIVQELDDWKRLDIKLWNYIANLLWFTERSGGYRGNFFMKWAEGEVRVSKDYKNLRTIYLVLHKYDNWLHFCVDKQATLERIEKNIIDFGERIKFYKQYASSIYDIIERQENHNKRYSDLDYRIRSYLSK